jgi:hypothetical protein
LTGTPTAPTATTGTANTQIATTEFVSIAVSGGGGTSTWTQNGVNLYPNATTTNVAIGATDTLTSALYVNGNVRIVGKSSGPGLYVENYGLTVGGVNGSTSLLTGLSVKKSITSTDAYISMVNLTNPSFYNLSMTSTSLGQTQGNKSLITNFQTSNGDLNNIQTFCFRYADGSTWLSASTRMQCLTNSTEQSYIEFNPPSYNGGIGMTNSTGVGLKVDQSGYLYNTSTQPDLTDSSFKIPTTNWVQSVISNVSFSSQIYGSGIDGDIILNSNGSGTPSGFFYDNGAFTMTREVYARNITLNNTGGLFIRPNGFRLFCSGTCTCTGGQSIIECNGNSGYDGTITDGGNGAAAILSGLSYQLSSAGGKGGAYNNSTTALTGANTTNSFTNGLYGNGGNGGSGYNNIYVAVSGATTVKSSSLELSNYWNSYLNIYTMVNRSGVYYQGGAGGAGGGGSGPGTQQGGGGGGGSGGGALALFIKKFNVDSTNTIAIRALGGNGGNGYLTSAPSNYAGNGGGGGGGGFILLCTSSSPSSSIEVSVSGGFKGSGSAGSSAVAPSNGAPGIVAAFYNLQ